MDELGRSDAQAEAECPDCLKFQVHTPVEGWKGTRMNYCTFHYWMMKGREDGIFTLDAYVERSQHFGFVISLPSPEDIAVMMKQDEGLVVGPEKIPQELAISAVAS